MDNPNNYNIGQKKQLYKFLKQEISILWVEYLSEVIKRKPVLFLICVLATGVILVCEVLLCCILMICALFYIL